MPRSLPSPLAPRRLIFEPLEPRRLLAAGVTVITHGAQASGGLPDWTITMGQAILDRADGPLTTRTEGSIFQHNPATGLWAPVGGGVWANNNDPADHIVLLYDWSDESLTFEDGWLEAAADNLFASLVADNANLAGALADKNFFEIALDAGGGADLANLHFIGHSRGGVLNSLVAERFDYYFDVMIDHVTTLDAHPASLMNDPGYVATSPSANSRVFTYDNVLFADNYFQQDGAYEPLTLDFDGVIANGAYNLQLPSAVLENGGATLEHSDVHSWYYGTITASLPANYSGFSGAARNNDGDSSFPDAWWGASGVPARAATGFAFSMVGAANRTGLPTTGVKIPAAVVASVFNGDQSRSIDGIFSDSLPGWESHGGGGTAPLGGSDLYFELNAGSNDYIRRHNPLYFARHTAAVQYDYWINDSDAVVPDDVLLVLVGGDVVDTVSLANTTASFVRNRQAMISSDHAGFVATIEFQIQDLAASGVESAVRIDNVRLVVQTPPPIADFNGSGLVDGIDFLAWQRGLGKRVTATRSDGDANSDGNVRGDDLALWRQNFGEPSVQAQSESLNPFAVPGAAGVLPLLQESRPTTLAPQEPQELFGVIYTFVAPNHRARHVPVDEPACNTTQSAKLAAGHRHRGALDADSIAEALDEALARLSG